MEQQKRWQAANAASVCSGPHRFTWALEERGDRGQEVTSTLTTACLCLLKARKSRPSVASFWYCHPPICHTAPASGSLLLARPAESDAHLALAGPATTTQTNTHTCEDPGTWWVNDDKILLCEWIIPLKLWLKVQIWLGIQVYLWFKENILLVALWELRLRHVWRHKVLLLYSPFFHLQLHTYRQHYRITQLFCSIPMACLWM